jgi:TPR repeat protein
MFSNRICAIVFALMAAPQVHAEFDALDMALVAAVRNEARAHEQGAGRAKDSARAVTLYCMAARAGDVEAQYSLGRIYAGGRGVVRDEPVAALFFMLAAQQGHEEALQRLRAVGEPTAAVPQCLLGDPQTVQTGLEEGIADAPRFDVEPFVAITPAQKKALEIVNKLAPEYGVTPRLALAVIRAESNFDPAARSEKNAQGLMQLIPETSTRFNVGKPFDPAQNVRGGLAYLRWLLAYFQGNVALVAAAYNAGERAVDRHRGVPPYPETRGYVKRVVRFYGRDDHPYDGTVTEPSAELHTIRAASSTP